MLDRCISGDGILAVTMCVWATVIPYLFTCIYSIATGPLILVSFKGRHVVFTVPMGHVNKGMVKKVKLAP